LIISSEELFQFLGQMMSTIGEEKLFNPRLTKTKEEFIEIMANLNLDLPKMIGWQQITFKLYICFALNLNISFININSIFQYRYCCSQKYGLWSSLNNNHSIDSLF
jgi:hypothetical protein